MNEIDVMYSHQYTSDGHRFTIAGIVNKDDLILGIAICSESDSFNKSIGRSIATGRVLNQRNHHGVSRRDLYAGANSFQKEGGGYDENYFVGNEIKVFREEVYLYNFFTKNELIVEFGLKKIGDLQLLTGHVL